MKIWNLPVIEFIPFDKIEESRPVALVTTGGAWEAVANQLEHIHIVWRSEVTEATIQQWIRYTNNLQSYLASDPSPITIYAVGGGLAVDAAKYIAHHTKLDLTCLPTALSVDAFLTWASGIRHKGCVQYLETKSPDKLYVDFRVLTSAPVSIRAAGICDVLSIATGLWDWEFAEEKEMNPPGMELIPWVADAAEAILQGALDCADAAGAGDPEGLKQLLDCLAMEVQLCNQLGHSRPEEGSEHYFAYSVENVLGKGLPHGELVGPGILLFAKLQDQDIAPLKYALDTCQIPLDKIPNDVVETTLEDLPEYVRKHELPFGIAHDPESWNR